ncbi:MAG: hypothetical protein H0U76_18380 [Ktedonobacteraceae bacterium]|nr:hypothetical protein [Ktedonobacteraceae bacterium]
MERLSQSAQSPVLDKSQNPLMARGGGAATYAFVRNEQLWVKLPDAQLVQATHFDYTADDGHHLAVLWNQLSWFDGDHYIAFKLLVTRGGFGGAGCGYIGNNGATSALFILDTRTMQTTEITVPGENTNKSDKNERSGQWQYLFTDDSLHLLAWHTDLGNKGGLYRYDFSSGKLSLALSASKFPEVKLSNDSYFPMRLGNGQLYYEAMTKTSGSLYDHVIYSHSIDHPEMPSVKVLDAGTHLFCDDATGNRGQYREPGWDVSSDGQYLVVQKIVRDNQGKETSTIQMISLYDGTVTPLFSQLTPTDLSHDLTLSWAPDHQTIVVQVPTVGKDSAPQQEGTFYSTTVGQPTEVRSYLYKTNFQYQPGRIAWSSDSASFALSVFYETKDNSAANVYDFVIGNEPGHAMLNGATNFIWA